MDQLDPHCQPGRAIGHGFVHEDPVRIVDGAPALLFSLDGRTLVLRGSGCAGFLPGWRALFLFSGFAPILLMQLAHENGARAVWYLDPEGNRLGDQAAALQPADRALLHRAAGPVLSGMVRALLQDPDPEPHPAAQGFLALDEGCRLQLLALCRDHLVAGPLELLSLAEPGDCPLPAMFQHARVLDLLEHDLQAMLPGIVASSRFSVPSPVGGAAIAAQGSLCLDDFHFAYRFVEPSNGVVFFLIAGHEHSQIYALYLPHAGLLLHGPAQQGRTEGISHFLPDALSHHMVLHGAAFASYLSRPLQGVSVPLRAPPWSHIGHQLWNELSGIERFLAGIGETHAQPEWLVPDGDHPVEFYGAIDVLFPSLRGHVRRGLRHARDLIDHTYANGRLVIRATDEFVSAGLRRRLLSHAEAVGGELPALTSDKGGPILLLGLRVENRTLTDLPGFYDRLITAVRARHPRARFVIDGHNVGSAGGRKHRSHGEREPDATVAAERAILDGLRRRHGEDAVVSAVGLTVPDNLRLIAQCDGFVAMWGAGLAKYRWACNKPGYVISNRWNLDCRGDLRIYELPTMIEAPTPLRWLRASCVTDQPDSAALIDLGGHPQWMNFTIDEDAAIADILDFVGSIAAGVELDQ